MRRALGAALAGLLLVGAMPASAAAPTGPRLAMILIGASELDPYQLIGTDADGRIDARYTAKSGGDPVLPLPAAPAWSPDGSRMAFVGLSRAPGFRIFVIPAAGGSPRPVGGTRGGEDPVFAPDGRSIAFRKDGRRGSSVWSVGVDGVNPTRLTAPRRSLTYQPTSFSSNGSLLATRQRGSGPPEVVSIEPGGYIEILARDAADGVYSPDGSRIAYLLLLEGKAHFPSRQGSRTSTFLSTDLYTMNADGSDPSRISDTPWSLEVDPSWDPSGARIAVTLVPHTERGGTRGRGDAIVQMNADGSCARNVIARPRAAVVGAVWQPGPGRGAGPLDC